MTDTTFRLVGMLALPPLPGIPNYQGTPLSKIVDQAVADAHTLNDAGFTHLLLQNSWDVPAQTTVDPATIAIMTRVATEVRQASALPLGINVAHNDGPGALAIAFAVEAAFIRVKVLTGAAVGPDGIMAGCAVATGELRSRLGADVQLWADVNETTSLPISSRADDVWCAVEAVKFGGADALVVTKDSGVADAVEAIARIRQALPATPVIIGGRVTPDTLAAARGGADGAIIGTALKSDSHPLTRVDPVRAGRFAA